MRNLVILGAGTFAKEIADEMGDKVNVVGYVVQDKFYKGELDVIPFSKFRDGYKELYFLCAIVSTKRKQFIEEFYSQIKAPALTFVHSSVYLSKLSQVRGGSIICPHSMIASNTIIKNHCIINRGANIGHDCLIESYSTVGPGVNIAGFVKIGQQTNIGIGANILEFVTIGNNCTIGAGAVVTKDIPDNQTWYGVPAKYVR